MSEELNDISEKVKEYAEISKTIKVTQEKLKVLNKKKNILYKEVVPRLKSNNVTKCNLPFGTLRVVSSKRKVVPNKATMKEKYVSFFNTIAKEHEYSLATPEQKADMLFKYVYVDSAEIKESQNISMTYSKEFREQFKQLSF
jgi:hypothetical protein